MDSQEHNAFGILKNIKFKVKNERPLGITHMALFIFLAFS